TSAPLASSTNTPDRIRTASGSRRWVVKRDWPGRRRSRSRWMSAGLSGMRGGQPSTTQPIAAPWLSPKGVTRKRWPNGLKDMTFDAGARVAALYGPIAAILQSAFAKSGAGGEATRREAVGIDEQERSFRESID